MKEMTVAGIGRIGWIVLDPARESRIPLLLPLVPTGKRDWG